MNPETLLVLAPVTEEGELTGGWSGVVDRLAEVLAVAVRVDPLGERGGRPSADALLARAAAHDGPVLVLPDRAGDGHPDLARAVVPFDRSRSVTRALCPVVEALEGAGVDVEEVHVIARDTAPPMWEGPGHHASAWFDQLAGRHRVGRATVSFTAGDPATAVGERAEGSDLVVLCWGAHLDPGRSAVVRATIPAVTVPVLLMRIRPGPPEGGPGALRADPDGGGRSHRRP